MERNCIDCDLPLNGRMDKKFCSDVCRNNFNNRLNSDTNNLMRNINHALRKNRKILAYLNPEGKTTVSKERLLDMGYNFGYFTHIHKTKINTVYYFCYEYGYILHTDDNVTIVLRQKARSLDRE